MALTRATRGLYDSPWELSWDAIASYGLQRHVPRVAIGHGAATARVIVVTMRRTVALAMTRAVALAMADHGSTMARAMVTPTVCSAHGMPWQPMISH